MRIVLTGGDGFLSKKIHSYFSAGHELLSTSRTQETRLDITDRDEVEGVISGYRPDLVINGAAICDVEKCEQDPELAQKVHVQGTRNLAYACKNSGATLVYISTDYLFDGKHGPYKEDAPVHPLSVYGLTKYEGERAVREIGSDHLILRLPILYGYNDKNDKPTFVREVLESLGKKETVWADDCRKKYPLIIDDVGRCIDHLMGSGQRGTFNVATEKAYSRFEWAKRISEIFGYRDADIRRQAGSVQNRPQEVAFDITKIKNTGFYPLTVDQGLTMMMSQMEALH